MISLEKLNAVKSVVSHLNCSDGLASAILLKDAFRGRDLPIKFVQYQTEEHKTLVAEPGMLFVDFSPHPDRVQEFVEAGAIVLDHHKTAKQVVEAFGEDGLFGDEIANPGVCGAVLAYQHVWLPLRGPLARDETELFAKKFSTLAGVRDTWQRDDERWKEACLQNYILSFIPRERWLSKTFPQIASSWDTEYAWIGELLQEKETRTIRKIAELSYRLTTPKGTRVVIFEGVTKTSDLAELLHDSVDLVIGFNYETENGVPKVIFSTRSHTTFDCAAMCKAYGGGGHTKAAGFNRQLKHSDPNPYTLAEELVRLWEDETEVKLREKLQVLVG